MNQSGDIGADQRVEIGGFHIHAAQNMGTKVLRRLIDGAGHQQMVACADKGQNGVGDRRRAARIEHAACAALQLDHRILQREVGQGAASAVKQLAMSTFGGGLFFGRHGVKYQ
ncbi:hypothetical protein D3C71_1504020 [compost metagenome]